MARGVRVCLFVLIAVVCLLSSTQAGNKNRQRKEFDWRLTGGGRIKAVNYPKGAPVPTLEKQHKSKRPRKEIITRKGIRKSGTLALKTAAAEPIIANVVDSPPIDGFVPWIVLSVTDERSLMWLDVTAVATTNVTGTYPAVNSQTDYAIGLFDTGASSHVVGYQSAMLSGIYNPSFNLLTSNTVTITGATGSVEAMISQPLGIFIDGLGAVEPNGLLLDTSNMIGQTNVSVAVGQNPGTLPDLPTAIGSPLSAYFTAAFRNDRLVSVSRDGNDFTGPDITFYDNFDPCIPNYHNTLPLDLRPAGGTSVQFISDPVNILETIPMSPSIIITAFSSQSLFFIPSVDLYDANNVAFDKDKFILDTGAQITVIGSRIAARLGLDPAGPNDFSAEITGVNGDTLIVPGFYIDTIDIPALGEWLRFTNVPVVYLDVASPEGGTLDGIIGMNLFVNYNFVLQGGGLPDFGGHQLSFEPIGIRGDIAPAGGDGIVDYLDIAAFLNAWLATDNPYSANYDYEADLAPQPNTDGLINALDFAALTLNWLKTSSP